MFSKPFDFYFVVFLISFFLFGTYVYINSLVDEYKKKNKWEDPLILLAGDIFVVFILSVIIASIAA